MVKVRFLFVRLGKDAVRRTVPPTIGSIGLCFSSAASVSAAPASFFVRKGRVMTRAVFFWLLGSVAL